MLVKIGAYLGLGLWIGKIVEMLLYGNYVAAGVYVFGLVVVVLAVASSEYLTNKN